MIADSSFLIVFANTEARILFNILRFEKIPTETDFSSQQLYMPECFVQRARICKRLRSPGMDSEESISAGWEPIPGLL